MSRYKITLHPLDWFFFGGDQTFDNGESQSYMAISNRMPQQTTLLGMVRYQLLKKEHLLLTGKKGEIVNKKAMASLVGRDSFNIESTSVQSFGKIISLSPVFIQKGTHQLLPMPLTQGMDPCFATSKVWMSGKEYNQIIQSSLFNEKDYNNYCKLIDEKNIPFSLDGDDGIFASSMQIGITKAESNDENKNGFFKQETLRFRDSDTSFAFFLELEDGTTLEEDTVFIGAQRSCFRMKVAKSGTLFTPSHPDHSILLLSPAYISDLDTLDSNCLARWNGITHFRNFRQIESGELQSGPVSYHRHDALCTFLTAGSVLFYSDDKQKMNLEALLNNTNLQNIGYNHYSVK